MCSVHSCRVSITLMADRNAEFIDEMIADPVFADILESPDEGSHTIPDALADWEHSHSHAQLHSHAHSHASSSQSHGKYKSSQAETDLAQDKVRSTLRSFVRDWSDERATERKQCYDPCLDALTSHWKGKQRDGEVKVLVPGCGLGRLAMEIAARGQSGRSIPSYLDLSGC